MVASAQPATAGTRAPSHVAQLEIVPRRYWGRWIAAAVIVLFLLPVVQGFITAENMKWDVVAEYLFAPAILEGLRMTVLLTIVAMAVGIVLGIVLALMRTSANPVLSSLSIAFIYVFRGIPLLVQLLFWYFLAAVFPVVGIGIPFGPTFITFDTNVLIGQFTAAILGLGLSEAAYFCEIFRGGVLAVGRGQVDAGTALGMRPFQIFRRIILPQAMRIIVPATGNQFIGMLKTTSLVLVIALPELLTTIQGIYSRNLLQIPLLTVACFWYLIATGVLSLIQHFVERHYAKGAWERPRRSRRRHADPSAVTAAVPTQELT
ncbi:MAG: amino acid ABC transporter permease [Microbacterium sp.]